LSSGSFARLNILSQFGRRARRISPRGRSSSTRSSRQTILVVDDEDRLRFVVRRLLEEAGYGVIEAGNGLQALGS